MDVQDGENLSKNKMYKLYFDTKIRILVTGIVILGAINWGTTAFGYNLVDMLSKTINSFAKIDYPIDKITYIIVGLCGISLAFSRTTWLPFLGRSVLPGNLLKLQTPSKVDRELTIKIVPNSKVAYWAALPTRDNSDYISAYGDYSNSGVVMSDSNGIAKLPILTGSGYIVPSGTKLDRHLHYRVFNSSYGMMDKIKTEFY